MQHQLTRWRLAVASASLCMAAMSGWLGGCSRNAGNYPTRDASVEVTVETGSVNVNGGFAACPTTVVVQISPTTVTVGQSITVSGEGTSPSGGPLTSSWSSASGTFANAGAAATTFTCTQPGPAMIKLTVSNGSCETTETASAFCLAIADGGTGGAGGGGSGTGGAAGAAGSGGSGGGGGGDPGNQCPAHEPLSGDPMMCETCTAANCGLDPDPDGDSGCCALANAADQLLCLAVVRCFTSPPAGSTPNPCTTVGDGLKCFCGTSGGDCFMVTGAANGPCKTQVIAAAKSSMPTKIQAVFSDPASPLGRANNLLNCRGAFCRSACGIQ